MQKTEELNLQIPVINNNLIECYELFFDYNKRRYYPQYSKYRFIGNIFWAYVSAVCAMFTGQGLGHTKKKTLDGEERIAAIVFNLINFGGLASLIFGFVNLSPLLLAAGGILVLTGFLLAYQGAKSAKESSQIYLDVKSKKDGWPNFFYKKDLDNGKITVIPMQSDNELISNGI